VSVSSTSTTTQTHCATFVACSTEDSETTTTVTTSEAQSSPVSVAGYDILDATGAANDAAISSLASSIMSQRAVWDATRYSGLTVPPSTSTVTVTTSEFFSEEKFPSLNLLRFAFAREIMFEKGLLIERSFKSTKSFLEFYRAMLT
jgi:hypothetical protein